MGTMEGRRGEDLNGGPTKRRAKGRGEPPGNGLRVPVGAGERSVGGGGPANLNGGANRCGRTATRTAMPPEDFPLRSLPAADPIRIRAIFRG